MRYGRRGAHAGTGPGGLFLAKAEAKTPVSPLCVCLFTQGGGGGVGGRGAHTGTAAAAAAGAELVGLLARASRTHFFGGYFDHGAYELLLCSPAEPVSKYKIL